MAKGLGSILTKIPTSSITDSSVGITSLVTSGSASASTYLHGDLSWATVSVSGKINTAGSDPVTNTAGDIWYTGGKFKFTTNQTLNSVWSSANSCSSGCTKTVGCGTQSAGLKWGGETPPGTGVRVDTEEFNGVSWANGGNLNYGRTQPGGLGTQTAALCEGGHTHTGTPKYTSSETYDGSSWTNSATDPGGSRYGPGAVGTNSAGLMAVGYNCGQDVREWDGTSFIAAANYPQGSGTGVQNPTAFGTQTAATLSAGYTNTRIQNTNEYDGTSWAAGNNNPVDTNGSSGYGTQSAGLQVSGYIGSYTTQCYGYDGTSWYTGGTCIEAGQQQAYGGATSSGFRAAGYNVSSGTACEILEKDVIQFIGT